MNRNGRRRGILKKSEEPLLIAAIDDIVDTGLRRGLSPMVFHKVLPQKSYGSSNF